MSIGIHLFDRRASLDLHGSRVCARLDALKRFGSLSLFRRFIAAAMRRPANSIGPERGGPGLNSIVGPRPRVVKA